MKCIYLYVSVFNFVQLIQFYEMLFGVVFVVLKDDYVKWMFDDLKVNFVIFECVCVMGIDYIGIQVDSLEELVELVGCLKIVGIEIFDQEVINCCYVKLDKSWVYDLVGVWWEIFFIFGEVISCGEDEVLFEFIVGVCCGLVVVFVKVCC